MDTALLSALDQDGQKKFEHAIAALQGDLTATMATLNIDPKTRLEYGRRIKLMSDELYAKASRGIISWQEAAAEASETRNLIMELMRFRTTPVGKSIAQKLKKEGKTFSDLIKMKTESVFGKNVLFEQLSSTQKDQVFAAIVKSSGKSNPKINVKLTRWGIAGKGLLFLTLAVAIYQIYSSDDKLAEAGHQAAIAGAGVMGGWLGGAAAGLVCGPGAPVCVVIGAFVGGALAAWEMDSIWN
ncbi:hypothetical protein [Mangrovibacter phragmitis]|uniref:hypothetical protein n=1 Tax=Mangrovibacter phragmitis TaxID=1691903 RepID=UPI00351278DA